MWPSVVLCLTMTICSTIYAQCTRFSLWWCMEHWVYITSIMKFPLWWLQRFWHAFLWWSWFGKSLDSLTYFGAHLLYFWVSDIFNLYLSVISLTFSYVHFDVTLLTKYSHLLWPLKIVGFELKGFIVLKMVEPPPPLIKQ